MVVAAETAGLVVLHVSARRWPIASGSYTLRLTGFRLLDASDRELLRAMRLRSEVRRADDAGNLELATARAAEALAAVERVAQLSDSDLAMFIFDLARLYSNGEAREKARLLLERSLSLLERSVGPNHPRTAGTLQVLGGVLMRDGDYVRADAVLHRALEIQEKALAPDDPALGFTLQDLGSVLERRGDLTKAEELDLRALAIFEKAQGRVRLHAGTVLNNLGVTYLTRRDYRRAGEYLERALPLREAAYGSDSVYVAMTLQNLGIVAREAKDYAKAEEYYLRALASREKSLGPEHPDIAANLINLANVYRSKGDYHLALETHLRALRMFERTAAPSAPFPLLSLVNVARTYAVLGDLPNAVSYQTRLERATETAIALNLSIGSDRQRVAYLTPIAERTERTLSLNLQMTPGDPDSTALAVTVLLQRKGRVIDAAADMQAALRRRTDAESQALLDQLNDVVGQLARLVLNGPQKTPVDEYRKSIAALEEQKEQLESKMGRRSAE
jgi:tetratricopeptide (TPR) repeat protein